MKKMMKVLLVALLCMGLFGCGNNKKGNDYVAMQKDLEDQGFVFEAQNDVNYALILNKDYAPSLTFGINKDKVSLIMYINFDVEDEGSSGIVYLSNKELEKSADISDKVMDNYRVSLKDMGYSEEEMIALVEWYYQENK